MHSNRYRVRARGESSKFTVSRRHISDVYNVLRRRSSASGGATTTNEDDSAPAVASSLAKWTVDDVTKWLRSLDSGLGKYASKFDCVDGSSLLTEVDEEFLESLISDEIDREALWKRIQFLRRQANSSRLSDGDAAEFEDQFGRNLERSRSRRTLTPRSSPRARDRALKKFDDDDAWSCCVL